LCLCPHIFFQLWSFPFPWPCTLWWSYMRYESLCKGIFLFLYITLYALSNTANADDGYTLWFKYQNIDDKERLREYQQTISSVIVSGNSKTCRTIRDELKNSLPALLGKTIPFEKMIQTGTLLIGTPSSSDFIKKLTTATLLDLLGQEGYVIKSV